MTIQQKLNQMQSKLLNMQQKLEEEDKDPVKKALNEEAVKQAAIEYFGEEKGLNYIEEADLAEATMSKKEAKNFIQKVLNPLYFGNMLAANIFGKYKIIFNYSKFFGMISKHKKKLLAKEKLINHLQQ